MVAPGSTPWIGQAAGRWGHWGATWLIACIVAILGIGVWPFQRGSIPAVVVPLLVLAFALTGWLVMRRHDRALCEVCVRAMPLNASEVASRYRRQFAVAHAATRGMLGITYLCVLVGSNLVLLHLGPTARICWAVIQSSMIYLVLAYSSHRRFQPWCPQCQSGDGGNDRVITPEPIPHGGQPY